MNEIDQIKRERIIIEKTDYGWDICHHLASGGIAPTSSYDTAQEAGARALQLLKLKEPVTPQSWPEIAQIGGPASPPPKPPSQ